MSITVIKPGLLSSFQDLGRFGHQHLGVPVGGAMDGRAHRLANLLAGNTGDEATLEVTLVGPTLRFDAAGCIAISGAHLSPTLNQQPIPNNRPLIVRAGDVLAFGARTAGLRSYIAWNGGIALPSVLGSRSTYLRGGFGGFHGRALRKGDVLNMLGELDASALDDLEQELWRIKVYLPAILGLVPRASIRVMRGAHTPLFTDGSIADFFAGEYRIGPQSERMGYRLQGAQLLLKSSTQLLSEATSFGSIQVPPDGNPIILMADRQTTGGYAKIGHVATVDLPVIAQCMPGETLSFTEIALTQAQRLDSQREEAFAQLHRDLSPLRALFER
ncbi:carboxylase [Pollutimonas subterranea]|uniref:Carboxylase n=1 Tax=Pollutimonas subterranea TaxID=2045210 RepID=A0A2N4U1E4_9BURK|nr:biotin-dependent carboxyltransferase family protein [Pollutimonas subterranea]PLC48842.1 carboxylase [Pollutimonas subterranea]